MEKKERRIAVAVDESEESMYALSWCLRNFITQNKEDTFILLYAKPPFPAFSSLDGTAYLFSNKVAAAMEKYSRDLVDSVMERAKVIYQEFDNVKIEKKVGCGYAKDVICEMVENVGADILVMGSHGYGFIMRALLGSVSDHCAKKVKCPVLVIKRPKN
ncbi:universal stress protein PHOS32 [Magnolia sinica]|uniref:universal stress protein PHOS32 n=1 Tax=Magnolia sinica TaxID=86752 RepID=UPI002657C7EB|nr:universal stress protein PHOS32 [Magnolia sinica]